LHRQAEPIDLDEVGPDPDDVHARERHRSAST
jgi:hypothetical protein